VRPSSRRVLVIDDDRDLRTTLAQVLTDEGYAVVTAANGAEGLTRLHELHEESRPDVILLDLMMPVMNGAQFRRAQLDEPELAAIPVLVMTAAGERAVVSLGELHAASVLYKPVGLEALLNAIQGAVSS
jgi:CheY-like chemotaxis protein